MRLCSEMRSVLRKSLLETAANACARVWLREFEECATLEVSAGWVQVSLEEQPIISIHPGQ